MALEIRQFPCLSDNYGYLIHDPDSGETATIDTPDPEVILREAEGISNLNASCPYMAKGPHGVWEGIFRCRG